MQKQFEMTRGSVMKLVKDLNVHTADIQPEGFNNTLHWHVGHILLAAENFMFGFPKKSNNLPLSYMDLFGMGSKPSNWPDEVPSIVVLTQQLEEQSSRVRQLPPEFFEEKLPFKFPFGNNETFGDLFGFMLYHEATHLGQMQAMKRLIERT